MKKGIGHEEKSDQADCYTYIHSSLYCYALHIDSETAYAEAQYNSENNGRRI